MKTQELTTKYQASLKHKCCEEQTPLGANSFCYEHLSVAPSSIIIGEKALVAQKDIEADTLLFFHEDKTDYIRTRTSIQVGPYHHLEAGEVGAFINHSCSPNCKARTRVDPISKLGSVAFYAVGKINAGDEITFDYATTETEITHELSLKPCLCKSSACRGRVYGFGSLPLVHRGDLMGKRILADHIVQMLDPRNWSY